MTKGPVSLRLPNLRIARAFFNRAVALARFTAGDGGAEIVDSMCIAAASATGIFRPDEAASIHISPWCWGAIHDGGGVLQAPRRSARDCLVVDRLCLQASRVARWRPLSVPAKWLERLTSGRDRGHSPNWRLEFHPEVDFCVWCLVADGFGVPPFDAHAAGRGELSSAGLSADVWRHWVERVVGTFEAIGRVIETNDDSELEPLARLLDEPHTLLDAAPPLRSLIAESWQRYQVERPKGLGPPLVPLGERLMRGRTARRLGGLHIYVVQYPEPRVARFSIDCVVTGWDFKRDSLDDVVRALEGAARA